jgi:hypothetical protein
VAKQAGNTAALPVKEHVELLRLHKAVSRQLWGTVWCCYLSHLAGQPVATLLLQQQAVPALGWMFNDSKSSGKFVWRRCSSD